LFDVTIPPEQDAEVNALGVKGLGEFGDASADAVRHATGVRICDPPIRLEKSLAA